MTLVSRKPRFLAPALRRRKDLTLKKAVNDRAADIPASRWRQPPPRAATRARCMVAIVLLVIAVIVATIPSFAHRSLCPASSGETVFSLTLETSSCAS